METFAEQFIPSDKSLKVSEIMKKISIGCFIIALFMMVVSLAVGIAMILLAITLFLTSMSIYVDYEYEFFDGTLSVTKIFNMSKRRTVLKLDKQSVTKAYALSDDEANNNRTKKFYTTNIANLQKYNFELNNGKTVQLALNGELSKLVNIYFR